MRTSFPTFGGKEETRRAKASGWSPHESYHRNSSNQPEMESCCNTQDLCSASTGHVSREGNHDRWSTHQGGSETGREGHFDSMIKEIEWRTNKGNLGWEYKEISVFICASFKESRKEWRLCKAQGTIPRRWWSRWYPHEGSGQVRRESVEVPPSSTYPNWTRWGHKSLWSIPGM